MNYLSLCQRVHEIAGFQGQFTSVDVTGYQSVITQAVKDAYEDIQRYRKEWNWLKSTRTINVSDAATEYTIEELWAGATPDFAEYRFIDYHRARGIFRLIEVPYDAFVLMDFSSWGNKEPYYWSSRPWDKALLISPVDQVYTLDLHYTKKLDVLKVNTDVPKIPDRHHQLIVYGALMKVSTFMGNPTLYDTYNVKYSEELGQLMREENPAVRVIKRPIA